MAFDNSSNLTFDKHLYVANKTSLLYRAADVQIILQPLIPQMSEGPSALSPAVVIFFNNDTVQIETSTIKQMSGLSCMVSTIND